MSPRVVRPPAIRYRPARRTDVDTLAELMVRTYRVSSLEGRKEFFLDHPRFTIRDVRVGELDGQIVAALVLYPLHAWVRGQRVPVTGIGSVGVSPEHRRRGIGEALIKSALREMRARGDAFSLLYAFRASWYANLGWGLSETAHLLSVHPTALPASEEARRVRKASIPDRPAVQALYDRVAREGHFALERRPEWWEKRLWAAGGDWVVYEGRRRGDVEGYLQYEVDSADGPWKLAVTVNEFVASTPAAHRGLWGYLHAMREQAVEIVAAVPADNAWLTVLGSAQNQHPGVSVRTLSDTGNIGYGAMLRLVDARAAIEALPVAANARGEVLLEIADEQLPANSRAWRVQARDGRLHVRSDGARAGGSRLPKLVASASAVASIVSGTLSPVRAAEAGLVDDVRGAAAVMEPWFRARPAHLHPLNAF